jgi:hypothetical protein
MVAFLFLLAPTNYTNAGAAQGYLYGDIEGQRINRVAMSTGSSHVFANRYQQARIRDDH